MGHYTVGEMVCVLTLILWHIDAIIPNTRPGYYKLAFTRRGCHLFDSGLLVCKV